MLSKYTKLLTTQNSKIKKGTKKGYLTFGVHLSPSNKSGYNVCSHASKGCRAACLNMAGRGPQSNVQRSRIAKTRFFFEKRRQFLDMLKTEIESAIRKAAKNNLTPCFRLNLTSDLPFESMAVMQAFPDVQFYDYTKNIKRMDSFLNGGMPENYHLTFSRSETKLNQAYCDTVLGRGGNVAAVFRNRLPNRYKGFKVFGGDETDLRFLDPSPCYVGLIEKGPAKKDETGFVISL